MDNPLEKLVERSPKRVGAVLNVLVEAPYFYREDSEELFFFLRRHRIEFGNFFERYFGWSLVLDAKCARVTWHRSWLKTSLSQRNVAPVGKPREVLNSGQGMAELPG